MSIKNFSPYVPRPATLVAKQKLSDFVTLFTFEQDNGKPLAHKPGQFVNLSIYGVGEAPFSISSPPEQKNVFELAVRKIGTVTQALHALEPGAKIGIRGPYGSFFPVQQFVGKDTLFVAGGLGYIPLRSLLRYQLRHREEFGRIIVLIGTRDPKERIFTEQIKRLGERGDVEVLETVDRGDETWQGNVGLITTLLPKVQIDAAGTFVAMVGPPIMYRFVIADCRKIGIPAEQIYVSLERKMKCGLGKCGHCQINDLNACIDGPVFRYTDIEAYQEAI
ncbi:MULTISPECIES: FAD/NAD(P)-binding protein [Desulfovibrio]|jgi:NAD(P)H-flavin reductase|uniref:FAD/NAD(P)-binding protein n=1 Tax=Desulfovibrio TaxID=872 RepID=UPI000423D3B0|nr:MULTISPECIES: FAD/NAD(P)-binding protein [Desulfovibrio]MDY0306936.1 FAD/NAD(P)-binding protein [Desulfovibrionaceae bacterium]HMM37344.1 FAD/NAD(P)-binding protein [Desulfovibrio sp.]